MKLLAMWTTKAALLGGLAVLAQACPIDTIINFGIQFKFTIPL